MLARVLAVGRNKEREEARHNRASLPRLRHEDEEGLVLPWGALEVKKLGRRCA
jgi:hypothetical protein